jgi:hypothetical protein
MPRTRLVGGSLIGFVIAACGGVYQIGMLESGNLPVARAHLVLVGARTGEIVGFVERDWDYDVDGYP